MKLKKRVILLLALFLVPMKDVEIENDGSPEGPSVFLCCLGAPLRLSEANTKQSLLERHTSGFKGRPQHRCVRLSDLCIGWPA